MIDKTQNIWKTAGRLLDLECARWREIGLAEDQADDLTRVASKLTQLGYLPPAERKRILKLIDDEAEQRL